MRSSRLRKLAKTLAVLAGTTAICGCYSMNGFVMNSSGQNYYEQGNYPAAAAEFQQAMMNNPTNPDYMANLAKTRWKMGDANGAEQLYRQALTVSPSHQPSYHGMAELMLTQGRGQEATAMLGTWTATQPYIAESHLEMAWLQRELGQHDAAAQSLQQALQVNPSHSTALAHLGQYYHDTGHPDQAVAMYQQSLNADWNQPEVHSRLAAAAQATGGAHPMAATAMARGVHPYAVPRQQTVFGPPNQGVQMAQMQQQQQLMMQQQQMAQRGNPGMMTANYPGFPGGRPNPQFASAARPMAASGFAPVPQVGMNQMPMVPPAGIGQSMAAHPGITPTLTDAMIAEGWSIVPGSLKVTESGPASNGQGTSPAATATLPAPQPDPGFSQSAIPAQTHSISASSSDSAQRMTAASENSAIPEVEAF